MVIASSGRDHSPTQWIWSIISQVLASAEPEKTLAILEKMPGLFSDPSLTPWKKILASAQPDKILIVLEKVNLERGAKLKQPSNPKITTAHLDQIVNSAHPRLVLYELETNKLLSNPKITTAHLDKILNGPYPEKVLEALEKYSELLSNEKITPELVDKIFASGRLEKVLMVLIALEANLKLLSNPKITTAHLDKILNSAQPEKVLEALGKYPELLTNPKITSAHLDKILNSAQPEKVLEALGKYPELLTNPKITSAHWDKIFNFQDPGSVLVWLSPKLLSNEKITPELLDKILASAQPEKVLEALGKYPELLTNPKITSAHWDKIFNFQDPGSVLVWLSPKLLSYEKITPELLDKILASAWPAGVLLSLGRDLDLKLLSNPKITTAHLDKILDSAQPTFILHVLGDLKLLSNEKITSEFLDKILASAWPAKVVEALERHSELLSNEKITSEFLDKILASARPEQVLIALGTNLKLLSNPKITTAHVDKILASGNSAGTLEALGKYPELLSNEKITPDLLNKILASGNSAGTLEALGKYPELLSNPKITSDLLNKILASYHSSETLEALGKYPELLSNPKITADLLNEILASSFSGPLEALGKYPELLSNPKITSDLLNKIIASGNSAWALEALGKYPELLSNPKITTAHLDKILDSAEPEAILESLAKNSKLLEDKNFTPEFLAKIFLSPKARSILNALAGTPSLLTTIPIDRWDSILASKDTFLVLEVIRKYPNIATLDRELWNIALSSPKPDRALKELRKYPELLKIKQFTPELLSLILSVADFSSVFATLNKYPQLLNPLKIDDLEACFASPEKAQAQLLVLGKQLAIDALQNELNLDSEKLKLLTALIDKNADTKMVKAFFKLGDQGIQYAYMYLNADPQKTQLLNAIMAPYVIARLEQLESKSAGPFLNLPNILKDPEAHIWNRLPIREGNIDEDQWKQLGADFHNKMQELFPGDQNIKKLENALKWFDKMPQSRDAQAGLQVVRQRVASIIDFIIQQKAIPKAQVNEALINEGVEIADELVKILADGGTACPDRAAVALETAEMYAKAFTKKEGLTGDYALNVVVNEYKRNLITAKFVDPKQGEAIETQLYHMILLNGPLGLEYATKSMLYQRCAIKTPLGAGIQEVYSGFTPEDLIGFVQEHPLIQPQFRSDAKALLDFKRLISDKDKGLGLGAFGAKEVLGREMRFADITQLEIIDSDMHDNSEEYIKRLEFLMKQAPSEAAMSYLRERVFEADYAVIRDELFTINKQNAEKLDAIASQMEKMIGNLKAEKTKDLLTKAGFLSPAPNYKEIDYAYFSQEPVDFAAM